jgi:hypothetical protein
MYVGMGGRLVYIRLYSILKQQKTKKTGYIYRECTGRSSSLGVRGSSVGGSSPAPAFVYVCMCVCVG